MKNILFFGILLFTANLFSQTQGTIKGTVYDEAMNNEPLLFANVQLKGATSSQETNFHGNFEFSNITPGTYTLIFSYTGYQTKEQTLIVQENTTTKTEAKLSPIEISFDDITGLELKADKKEMLIADSSTAKE